MKRPPLDPDLLNDRLAAAQGKRYWSSLEQMADDPAAAEMVQREFPDGASEWADPISRRRFLRLMGASLALGGLVSAGCMRPPAGTIRPFVRQPENLVPGKPLYYATSMSQAGYAVGLLAETHEGRPTKIEGNPLHPASRPGDAPPVAAVGHGATSPQHQAAILALYDPDRAKTVTYRGQPRSWGDLAQELRARLAPDPRRKRRLAVLTETVGSPTLKQQLDDLLAQFREADGTVQADWFVHEPIDRDNVHEGCRLAFGGVLHHVRHDLAKADVVVSLDADFFTLGPSHLVDTRSFMSRRKAGTPNDRWNRLYVVETNLSLTGAKADERLAVRPDDVERFLRLLALKLREQDAAASLAGVAAPSGASVDQEKFAEALAKDLVAHKGKSLLLVGDGQPPAVHALAHALNEKLGNVGRTVFYSSPLLPDEQPPLKGQAKQDLRALLDVLDDVDTLLILGGNPAYAAPADVAFGQALREKLAGRDKGDWLAVHCGPYYDETARLCHWHVPQSHFLEAWSDAVAFDGTLSVVQPSIAPLYASKSLHEVVGAISKRRGGQAGEYDDRSGLEMVRDYWRDNQPPETKKAEFDVFWQVALHDGVVPAELDGGVVSDRLDRKVTPYKKVTPTRPVLAADLARQLGDAPAAPAAGIDVVFAPDPGLHDGRFANLGWLQEWPRPITRLTWDNAALMSRATADKLGVTTRVGDWRGGEHGDLSADKVTITVANRWVEVAVFIVGSHADDAVTLHLGYGRPHAGRVGGKVGVDANRVRLSRSRRWASAAKVEKAAGRHVLACVQAHHDMEGRDIVRSSTLEHHKHEPGWVSGHDHHAPKKAGGEKKEGEGHARHPLPTMFALPEYPGYRWGMTVDLTACVGCGACVVACQAENNTPVVGKEQVIRGREMHWIRVSTYFEIPKGSLKPPRSWHFQPVMCQHCETAPCEVVCPVEATAHGDEGTNDMVYNRCVGTRYCSHNCPYKVRRFNFLNFTEAAYTTPSLKLGLNPDVSVRTRGVMEKCSYCIQRVSYARIEAAKEAMDELDKPAAQRTRRDANGKDGAPRQQDGKEIPLIRDGEVVSACAAACPADAIVFGDLNDKASLVRRLQDSALRYDLLGDHGTRPRTAYLAELRNPNPELTPAVEEKPKHG